MNNKSDDNFSGHIKPNELHTLKLKNGKNAPDQMVVQIGTPNIPNHAHILIKLPNEKDFEDLGDLPIINGTIFLPVPFVFLSYANEDSEQIGMINSDLRKKGVITWQDKRNLLPGDNWRIKIEKAILSSDYVLVFLSSKSINKRGMFQREIKLALDQMMERLSEEAYVIPILLDNCKPPREFKDIQWVSAWEDGWFERLLLTLRQ